MNNQKSDWFVHRFMNRVVDDDVYRAVDDALNVAVDDAVWGAVYGAVKDDPDHPALQVFLWEVTA